MIALAVFAVPAVLTLWYPVRRTFAHFEINYNEGWNAYRARMAASGVPLYGAPPRYTITDYPPLSFHVVGFLGRINGDVVAAGRYLALLSFAVAGGLVALIARAFTGGWRAPAYAALSAVIGIAMLQPDRIGMDDPQLFATTLSLAGFYACVRRPDSLSWMGFSAAAFAASCFTKHNLLAFPLAVAVYLVLTRRWKQFATWAGVLVVCSALLVAAIIRVDGPYLWAHLFSTRSYSLDAAVSLTSRYLQLFWIPVAGSLAWSVWKRRDGARGLLAIGLIASLAFAFGFSGGSGVDGNIFFDSIIIVAIITAVAASDLAPAILHRRLGTPLLTVLLLAPAAGFLPGLAERLQSDSAQLREIPALETNFRDAVRFVRSRPGPALCNNLLVCFEAGKPEEVDTFLISSWLGVGRISESEALALAGPRRFSAIELPATDQGPVAPSPPLRSFVGRVLENYHVGMRAGGYGLLIPNSE